MADRTSENDAFLQPPGNPAAPPQWVVNALFPHLASRSTYEALPSPFLTPNEAGKVPAVESDPRAQGVMADLANIGGALVPFGGPVAGATKLAIPFMGRAARGTEEAMNLLRGVASKTTNEQIIKSLPPPPKTHSERITARTKGMSDHDVLNSDELWAMSSDLAAMKSMPFSRAYSELAARRLGRELTPEEISNAMIEGARADVLTPRRLYDPPPGKGD
jgi:hypothetical protein